MFYNKLRRLSKIKVIFVVFFVIVLCGMYINSTAFFRLKLADHYIRYKNYDKAISTYKRILCKENLKPKDRALNTKQTSDIYFILANLLYIKNDLTESFSMFNQLSKINPKYKNIPFRENLTDVNYHKRFGSLLLRAGAMDMAVKQFQKNAKIGSTILGHIIN